MYYIDLNITKTAPKYDLINERMEQLSHPIDFVAVTKCLF